MTAERNPASPITPLEHPAAPSMILDRGMEEALLGGLLVAGDAHNTIFKRISRLEKTAFAAPKNRKLWGVMQDLNAEGLMIDDKTVRTRLGPISTEGEAYLRDLMIQAGSNPEHYAKVLEQLEWRRDAEAQTLAQLNAIRNPKLTGPQVAEQINSNSLDLLRKSSNVYGAPSELMSDVAAAYRESKPATDGEHGYPTGYPLLDRAMKGFKRGKVYGIVGRPGFGKSILGQNFLMHQMHDGRVTAIITLEMLVKDYFMRALCMESQIDEDTITRRAMDAKQRARFDEALFKLSEVYIGAQQMHMVYMNMPTMAQLRAKIMELHLLYGLEVLMIDYLDDRFVTPNKEHRGDSVSILGVFSKMIADIAKELNIVIISLLQTGRAAAKRGGTPSMEDVHGSASLEKDVDFMGVITIETEYTESMGYGETHLTIVKSRTGGKNQVIKFRSELPAFTFNPWMD